MRTSDGGESVCALRSELHRGLPNFSTLNRRPEQENRFTCVHRVTPLHPDPAAKPHRGESPGRLDLLEICRNRIMYHRCRCKVVTRSTCENDDLKDVSFPVEQRAEPIHAAVIALDQLVVQDECRLQIFRQRQPVQCGLGCSGLLPLLTVLAQFCMPRARDPPKFLFRGPPRGARQLGFGKRRIPGGFAVRKVRDR